MNPKINLAEVPAEVSQEPIEWKTAADRIAAISSFGISGTNAHVIVREPPLKLATPSLHIPQILTLSAKSQQSLEESIARMQKYLANHWELELSQISFSLNMGRPHYWHRVAIVANTVEQLVSNLALIKLPTTQKHSSCKVGFLFTGQGSQYTRMAWQLYQTHPEFKASFEECDKVIQKIIGKSLIPILFPAGEEFPEFIPADSSNSLCCRIFFGKIMEIVGN